MVGICFLLRILSLMVISKIFGPAWYDYSQTFFPCVKITCRESSKKILAVPCGWTSLSTLKLLPRVIQVVPLSPADSTALQPSRAPAEAASLSPSPREQQGVNMHSTCEGTWPLSPCLLECSGLQVEELVLSTLLWAGSEALLSLQSMSLHFLEGKGCTGCSVPHCSLQALLERVLFSWSN